MRLFRALAISFLLVSAAPARAGIGSLVKAIAHLGKAGAKVGSKAGAAGKLAKGGVALKGAKALGAGVAAERVFAHAALDGSRVGVFVADDGAGALRVVMQGGDELTHTPAGLRSMIDDLDEMADLAPEAGVDLFLDPDVLPRLGELSVGPNTRLWLANVDGASIPIRKAADDVVEAAVSSPGGHRIWLRLGTDAAQTALRIATMPGEADQVVVVDPDCSEVSGARVAADLGAALEGTSGTVVVLTDGELGSDGLWLAQHHGIDLVAIGLQDVCSPEGLVPRAQRCLEDARSATTYGELWAIASTGSRAMADGATLEGDWLHLRAAGLLAVHQVLDAELASDEPPLWIYPLAVVISVPIIWFAYFRKRDEDAA